MQNLYKISNLDTVLLYRNDKIINKFIENVEVSKEEAIEIYQECLKWLWLLSKLDHDNLRDTLEIPPPFYLLDEMWHTFILFTQDYNDFCNQYFGHYIHHTPFTKLDRESQSTKIDSDPEAYNRHLKRCYEYIASYLGEKTLVLWHIELPKKYYSHRHRIARIDMDNPILRTITIVDD